MKKKTKKSFLLIMILVIVLSGLASGLAYLTNGTPSNPVGKTEEDKTNTNKLSEEEQEAFVNEITSLMDEGLRPTEIELEIEKKINQLNKEMATKVIREYVISLDAMSNYYGDLIYVLGPELEYTKEVDQIENIVEDTKKLSNLFAKGFLDEAKRQHLVITSLNGYYYIQPDTNYVLNKYGAYIVGDYKEFLNLAAKQITDPLFDNEKEMYSVKRLKQDLEAIELSRDRWSEGDYAEDYQGMEKMLYEALFGLNHTTFFDLEVKNDGEENEDYIYKFKPEVRKSFESLILENNETKISKEMDTYLNVLEENDDILNTEVQKYLETFFHEKFQPLYQNEQEVIETKIDEIEK